MHSKPSLLTLIMLFVLGMVFPGVLKAENSKTMLIINSYNENEPWVNEMIQTLLLDVAVQPNVQSEIYDLNNALMADSTDFINVSEDIINIYEPKHPSYVVMIGNLAFNMRQQIKQAWGDVPMLLVSTIKDYATVKEYFQASNSKLDKYTHHSLLSEREEYNLTAIIIPEYYEQTVDLMVSLMPDMDHLVFMSDRIFANRKMANELQVYINRNYPEITFGWLTACNENANTFHNYVVERAPKTGILISSWLYAKHERTSWKSPTTSDLKLISISATPIFSLHESYISLGVVGGVYPSLTLAQQREKEVLQAMIEGKNMRDIPVYVCEDSYPCVNYRLLKKYNMPESACPPGTVFYGKPPTFFDKYLWQTITLVLLVLLVLLVMAVKASQQHKKIVALNRNKEFVANMPIPYSTATMRYDTDGNVTTIAYSVKNAAFERLIEDNVLPDSPFLLFPATFIAPKVTQLLKDHKTQMFMYHFDRTDTYYEFILCLVNTMGIDYKKEKNIKMIDVFAIDITRRHKTELRLERAMHALDQTISVAKLIPWMYDITKNTIAYDYTLDDAQSDHAKKEISFETFIDNEIYEPDRAALRQARDDIRSGRVRDFNIRLRKVDKDDPSGIRWFELTGAVTSFDPERKQKVVIGSSLDITERVRTQQEMAVALEKANESDRMKSAFLASMSHEIRTPLNAIVGFSNVIAHTESEEERVEFCDIINKSNEQLLALINDVLDLAKIESNTIDINYEKTDINAMIDHVRKSMEIKVPKGIKFTAIKGEAHCVAEIDENRIVQILNNLITNSCKFTPSGSITFGYEITENGSLHFYVEDTGIGISKENMEHVFERFFKIDTFVPGTGLGLSICRNLVEKMGGEIGVESAGEGQGSTFWFTVPYVPSPDALDDMDPNNYFFKKVMPILPLRPDRERVKILIAEDNDSNYRLLAHLLHDGFDLVKAENGNEAVRAFLREDPDVVLMDISMPGMDGYHALDEIRKYSSSVPIIAVTAYVYASDKQKILDYGFDGYVSKPITQKAIVDAIAKAFLK